MYYLHRYSHRHSHRYLKHTGCISKCIKFTKLIFFYISILYYIFTGVFICILAYFYYSEKPAIEHHMVSGSVGLQLLGDVFQVLTSANIV